MSSNVAPIRRPLPGDVEFQHRYQGEKTQVGQMRRDLALILGGCPVTDDAVLLASELSTNAVRHSRSGDGGQFIVRAEIRPARFVLICVEDQGGPWVERRQSDDGWHGLDIVRELAGEGNWGVEGNGSPGRRVWFRLSWPTDGPPPGWGELPAAG